MLIHEIANQSVKKQFRKSDDGESIYVDHRVKLKSLSRLKLPDEVIGNMHAQNSLLVDLKGCPSTIGGSFYIYGNRLTSLDGAPRYVGHNFNASDNLIESLHDVHKKIDHIGDFLFVFSNPLKESILGVMLIDGLKGFGGISMLSGAVVTVVKRNTPGLLQAMTIVNKYLPSNGRGGLIGCQTELLDNGFEEYAKL